MKIASFLYSLARKTNDIETLLTFDPIKIVRRLKNKLIGRLIGRSGIYRW